MIKVKIYELNKHRNETTFRPYIWAQNVLRDVGIEFTNDDSYDFAWVGQASITNKKVSLEQSVSEGLEFLETIKGDYMIFDGQDSPSLIGTYDVFKESNALLLLKNSLLKNRDLYKQGWVNGRTYFGSGDYSCKDFDKYSDKIRLSGTNWLSTLNKPQWYNNIPKNYDISALFGYPAKENYEYLKKTSVVYDKMCRKPVINILDKMESSSTNTYSIQRLVNGQKLDSQQYLNKMSQCKIVLSPHGYGEMNPRDIQALMLGSIIIKPDMSHIDSNPMWYEKDKTYIACKEDFSDLEEKIHYVLENFTELQQTIIPYGRQKFDELYTLENTAINTYNIFTQLETIKTD
jgi:hypothetical protein